MGPKKEAVTSASAKKLCVLLVCGLPGSGKSTLRQRLVKNGWAYVSQDEMLTADACQKALVKALKHGQSCVVDRCNVTPSDRRLWMQHAKSAVEKGVVKGVELFFEAVWMATPPNVCKERARGRSKHETLSPEKADEVIDSFCRGLRPPERSGQEPYSAVHVVVSSDDTDVLTRRFANPAKIDTAEVLQEPAAALAAAAAAEAETVAEAAANALAAGGGQQGGGHRVNGLLGAELFVVRHGERADKAQQRDDGWPDDPPLTKDGRQVAKQAGAALAGMASLPLADAVYSSPYYRCLQTANEIAAELGLLVRVEPGLGELCVRRIFDQQPRLRGPRHAGGALQRVALDASAPPHAPVLPEWPEPPRDANARVLQTARALAGRHPGRSVVLVCHAHSLVEMTRNIPQSGGGATCSTTGYCAMSHISAGGALLRSLDLTYLGAGRGGGSAAAPAAAEPSEEPCGRWAAGWEWRQEGVQLAAAGAERDVDGDNDVDDPVVAILSLGLEDTLRRYPAFARVFFRGPPEGQAAWREGWAARSAEVKGKLQRAHESGMFALSA